MIEALLRDVGLAGVAALAVAAACAPVVAIARARSPLARSAMLLRLIAVAIPLVGLIALGAAAGGGLDALAPSWAQAAVLIGVGALTLHWSARRFIDLGASRWWAAAPLVVGLGVGLARVVFVDAFFDAYIALFRSGVPPWLVAIWGVLVFGAWLLVVALWPPRSASAARVSSVG